MNISCLLSEEEEKKHPQDNSHIFLPLHQDLSFLKLMYLVCLGEYLKMFLFFSFSLFFFFFFLVTIFSVCRLEMFEAAVKDFLFISRGFCFHVNNPNSILIFNSLGKTKTARFVHCIKNTTSNGSSLYWIFKNERLLTMLTFVLHCLYRT